MRQTSRAVCAARPSGRRLRRLSAGVYPDASSDDILAAALVNSRDAGCCCCCYRCFLTSHTFTDFIRRVSDSKSMLLKAATHDPVGRHFDVIFFGQQCRAVCQGCPDIVGRQNDNRHCRVVCRGLNVRPSAVHLRRRKKTNNGVSSLLQRNCGRCSL